jgi:hypothetical protein
MSESVDKFQAIDQYHDYINNHWTGQAINLQSGYVFKTNFEIEARYAAVRPH